MSDVKSGLLLSVRRGEISGVNEQVLIESSPGELIDKITILEIKSERIGDPDKLRNVRRELEALRAARDRGIVLSEKLATLTADLRATNEAIWDVEEELRQCEQAGDFGAGFVELAPRSTRTTTAARP